MTIKTHAQLAARRAARMLPVVQRIARALRRRLPQAVDLDDLVAAGSLGLAEAIRNHGDADEETFEKNAVWRIRGAIFDAMRQDDVLTRCQRRKVRHLEKNQATVARPSLMPVAMGGAEQYHEARAWERAHLDARGAQRREQLRGVGIPHTCDHARVRAERGERATRVVHDASGHGVTSRFQIARDRAQHERALDRGRQHRGSLHRRPHRLMRALVVS